MVALSCTYFQETISPGVKLYTASLSYITKPDVPVMLLLITGSCIVSLDMKPLFMSVDNKTNVIPL
jgi:hypothetical protein